MAFHSDGPRSSADLLSGSRSWNANNIQKLGHNVEQVERISIADLTEESLSTLIQSRVVRDGLPLVISDFHKTDAWDPEIFTPEWLADNHVVKSLPIRDVLKGHDIDGSVDFYIREIIRHPEATGDHEYYLKDGTPPSKWDRWMRSGVIPESLLPFGSGDLLGQLSEEDRPETVLIYAGAGGSFTPSHIDPCASYGHNLLLHADPGATAIWLLTASHDSLQATQHIKEKYNDELGWGSAYLSPAEFVEIAEKVFVHEQVIGDLVIVPRRSCHQVVNRGGFSIKISWSRNDLRGLRESIESECPINQRICRNEIYKTRPLCYQIALNLSRHTDLEEVDLFRRLSRDDLETLIELLDIILASEWSSSGDQLKASATPGTVLCDFCGADPLQSYLECQKCSIVRSDPAAPEGRDLNLPYQMCGACYIEGRTCPCRDMEPVRRGSYLDLLTTRNRVVEVVSRAHPGLPGLKTLRSSDLASSPFPRTFEAATTLQRIRKKKQKMICCREAAKPGPPCVPAEDSSQCAACAGDCLVHQSIQLGLHPCKVLLLNPKGRGPVEGAAPGFLPSSARPADSLPLDARLAWFAINFPHCRPIYPSRPGWFDLKVNLPPAKLFNGHVDFDKDEKEHTDDEFEVEQICMGL